MNKTNYIHFGIGLVLATAGVAALVMSKDDATTSAATNYSSTWRASKVLTVDARVGSSQVGQIGLGVWEWTVAGSVQGGRSYTETWTGPSITGVSFTPGSQGCIVNGVDAAKIMAGCFGHQSEVGGPDTSSYTFAVRAPGDFTSSKARLNGGGSTIQKTTSCINSPRNSDEDECIFTSGTYGFQHAYWPGHPSRIRWVGGGALMPLEWTVSGTIN